MARKQGGRGHITSMAAALAVAVAVLFLAGAPRTAQAAVMAASAGIEEACRGAADRDAAVDYEHCVASLSSDAEGRDAADMHALAAAATRMAVEHAAATEARMEGLGEAEGSPRARARLGRCTELYGAAADVLRDALDNIRARVYGRAVEQIAAALGAAERCEDAWKGEEVARGGGGVPVAGHDKEYGRLAVVALGITSGIA
ncbi:putative invertase inhibitor [Aegilops tauschii subsp. strangulata]|nr:pectinesterase inhibitor 8-like [Aegilops tauschii subsp. strangulata]